MKKFNAEMKVVRFGAEDMIVTSGKFLTLSNIGNDDPFDNLMELGGVPYSRNDYDERSIRGPLSDYFEDQSLRTMNTTSGIKFYINNGSESENIRVVFGGSGDDKVSPSYNGTYTYDGKGGFVKQ